MANFPIKAQWQKEQKERKERLEVFQEVIRSRRNSAVSVRSATENEEKLPSPSSIDTKTNGETDKNETKTTVEHPNETKTTVEQHPEPSNTTCAQCIIL